MQFTSLLPVEEKLLESKYFARRLGLLDTPDFDYELNAFLSAARSVTFFLQKEMCRVPGFSGWWAKRQGVMMHDAAMTFFKDLRNRSQHRGRICIVGTQRGQTDGTCVWIYRFLGNDKGVPESLIHRDVVDCCLEHLAKLATIVLEFRNEFPAQSCYRYAITREGLDSLALDIPDVLKFFGLEHLTGVVRRENRDQVLQLLRNQVDGVDFEEIQRLARHRPIKEIGCETTSDQLSDSLSRNLVRLLAKKQE